MGSIPTITNAGKAMLIKAMEGSALNFTSIKIGNGNAPDSIDTLTDLVNPLVSANITDMTLGDDYITLTTVISNADLTEGFLWAETGIFAQVDGGDEELYAYCNTEDTSDYIPANDCGRSYEVMLNLLVSVGGVESVTATIGEGALYATKEALNEHINDTDNPHNVTTEQLGLENVNDEIAVLNTKTNLSDYYIFMDENFVPLGVTEALSSGGGAVYTYLGAAKAAKLAYAYLPSSCTALDSGFFASCYDNLIAVYTPLDSLTVADSVSDIIEYNYTPPIDYWQEMALIYLFDNIGGTNE